MTVSWRRRSEAFATASVLMRAPSFRNRDSTSAQTSTCASQSAGAYFYASVCTITGPATAVAGPMSRGARFCSVHADHIIGHETFDITDDRNGTLLDPACQLFGRTSLCLALTNGGVHGLLLYRRAARGRDDSDHASRSNSGGARAAGFPRILNPTPFPATTPSNWRATVDEDGHDAFAITL